MPPSPLCERCLYAQHSQLLPRKAGILTAPLSPPLLSSVQVMEGYTGALLAYGQSGGGKTHSMMGLNGNPTGHERGIIPRASADMLLAAKELNAAANDEVAHVSCSCMEIFNDDINDLLSTAGDGSLIRLEGREDRHLAQLHTPQVTSEEQVARLVEGAQKRRKVGPTRLNPVSSRSHMVFTLKLIRKFKDTQNEGHSKLYFVDLQGSESQVSK